MRNALRGLCLFALVLVATSGRAQTSLPDAPTTRIVSLVPSLTELLFTLGAGEQVVGVSDFCMYPDEARTRPRVGGLVNPNLERVLALRPTCVLLYRSQNDFAARLETLGIPTQLLQVENLADIEKASTQLGHLTGRPAAAAQFNAQLQAAFSQARQRAADLSTSLTGVIIVSRDPAELKALYQAVPISQLFQLAGGTLAIPGGAPVSREDIIRANPDIIIDMTQAAPDNPSSAPVRMDPPPAPWNRLTTIRAIRRGNLFYWKNDHALLPGPSVIPALHHLGDLLTELSRHPTPASVLE